MDKKRWIKISLPKKWDWIEIK